MKTKSKKSAPKKKVAKKTKKAAPKKSAAAKMVRHEIVVRAVSDSLPRPTETDLVEPMREGKKLTIPKTWMSEAQIIKIVQNTPKQHIYRRKGKGGQVFDYVTGNYIIKVLNFIFGWNWDFEIVNQGREESQVWVLGKLTCRGASEGQTIVKTQYGRADIKFKKESKIMLDYGNDLKAAATDALKKCASELGIASDIYGKGEYKEETGYDPRPSSEPTVALPEGKKQTAEEAAEAHESTAHHCLGVRGSGCPYGNDDLTDAEYNYSMKLYKKPLCRQCQRDAK